MSVMATEAEPRWAPVDDVTADLLSELSERAEDEEYWQYWLDTVCSLADPDTGRVDPNLLRERLRGKLRDHHQAGGFTSRAKSEGIFLRTPDDERAEYDVSNDKVGRNSGRPIRVYRLAAEYRRGVQ